jgi:hypothetical protein
LNAVSATFIAWRGATTKTSAATTWRTFRRQARLAGILRDGVATASERDRGPTLDVVQVLEARSFRQKAGSNASKI